jgi:hypothetical protein
VRDDWRIAYPCIRPIEWKIRKLTTRALSRVSFAKAPHEVKNGDRWLSGTPDYRTRVPLLNFKMAEASRAADRLRSFASLRIIHGAALAIDSALGRLPGRFSAPAQFPDGPRPLCRSGKSCAAVAPAR